MESRIYKPLEWEELNGIISANYNMTEGWGEDRETRTETFEIFPTQVNEKRGWVLRSSFNEELGVYANVGQAKRIADLVYRSYGNDLRIEFYQQDWMPGFASFMAGSLETHGKAFCGVNIGSFLATFQENELPLSELPYFIAESMMHEIIHSLESYFNVEFSEERIDSLIQKYADKYREQTK